MTATALHPSSERDDLVTHLTEAHCSTTADSLSLLGARLAHASAHLAGPACTDHDHARCH